MATKAKAPRKARVAKAKSETKSIIKSDAVANYEKTAVKTSEGTVRRSMDKGDEVAVKLRGKTLDELKPIAEKAGVLTEFNSWKKTLNPGQVRMNLGNKLRAQARAKEKKKAA